jgi:hypothetical protein
MKAAQPPITNDRELAGYWASAEHLRGVMERHEADVLAERQKEPADLERLDQMRTQLHHLHGYYTGSQDAIEASLGRSQSGHSAPRAGTPALDRSRCTVPNAYLLSRA